MSENEPNNPENPWESSSESSLPPGEAGAAPAAASGGSAAGSLSKDETNMAMLTHLLGLSGYLTGGVGCIVGPLVLWLIKKETMPFVDDQGKEAVNFNISFTIYMFVAALLIAVVVGFLILPVLVILHIVFIIMASMKASAGESYRYPMTIRLIK